MCMIFVIPAFSTIEYIAYFSATFSTLLFASPHNDKNTQIKVSLETDNWLNEFAMPACCRAYCT